VGSLSCNRASGIPPVVILKEPLSGVDQMRGEYNIYHARKDAILTKEREIKRRTLKIRKELNHGLGELAKVIQSGLDVSC
jgi:hypothetical protein